MTVQGPTRASEDRVTGCAAAMPVDTVALQHERQKCGEWSAYDSLSDNIPFEGMRADEAEPDHVMATTHIERQSMHTVATTHSERQSMHTVESEDDVACLNLAK